MNVHEMFYTSFHALAWFPPVAQIKDETRITNGRPAEARGRHARLAKEAFNGSQQMHGWFSIVIRLGVFLFPMQFPTCLGKFLPL